MVLVVSLVPLQKWPKNPAACDVQLEKVPLKYPGLEPWEIWISESQERMTLAVPRANGENFQISCGARGVEATSSGHLPKTANVM